MRKAIVGILMGVALAQAGSPRRKLEDPTPRQEEIFKRFVAEFVELTPGSGPYPATFEMGSDRPSESPRHTVTFTRPFAVARYEVTQELYQVVMNTNPSRWVGPRNAIEMASWHEAVEFCARVTKELRQRQLIAADQEVRLPTEAEWEYACRAGTTTAYSFGDDVTLLTDYAWYKDNSKGHDPPVGAKKANPWGLYDMHGYNWEWVQDAWHADYKDAPRDGGAWAGDSAERVIRGGAWPEPADRARSAHRARARAETRNDTIGFRCVRAQAR